MHLVLLVFGFVCFVLASFPQANPYWNRLVSVGLACWILTQFLASIVGK